MKRLLLVALALAGCADDLPEGWHLERTRVLAVMAHPTGDATRAWPRPGEETVVSWLVEAPGELPALAWSATVLADGAPFVFIEGSGPPEVRFVAPDAARLVVAGELRPDGEPATDLTFDLPVEHGAPNHHPHVGAVILPEQDLVAGGPDVELRVITAASDRETYLDADGAPQREGLRLSFFTTAGELERQYDVIERDDPDEAPEAIVKLTPPRAADVPAEGMDLRLTFVVRDLRGGVDFTTRTLRVRK
jgi:hypothetical protein